MPPAIIFEQRPNMLSVANHGPVEYWLDKMFVDGNRTETRLTAEVGDYRKRLGRWPHVTDRDDEKKARYLINKHHAALLERSIAGTSA